MKKMINAAILFFAAILLMSTTANAGIIFTNPITGTNPNTSNPYTTGQTFDANILVSGIGRGSGINGNNANNRYNANSWDTGSFDSTAYFTFTITPLAGFLVDFENFVYTGQASGTGPTSFAFRSSVDGFTNNVGAPSAAGTTINLLGAEFQGLTNTIEFRLYGWGASAPAGTFSVNDFSFSGTVSAVPEPSSLFMVGSVVVGLISVRRRRRV